MNRNKNELHLSAHFFILPQLSRLYHTNTYMYHKLINAFNIGRIEVHSSYLATEGKGTGDLRTRAFPAGVKNEVHSSLVADFRSSRLDGG